MRFKTACFIFTLLAFTPLASAETLDLALLCTPPRDGLCHNLFITQGACPSSYNHFGSRTEAEKVCIPGHLPEEMAKHCFAQRWPTKAAVNGLFPSWLMEVGMDAPYGIIFHKKLLVIPVATEKWFSEEGRIISKTSGYSTTPTHVETTVLGQTHRRTMNNRGVTCRLSSRKK